MVVHQVVRDSDGTLLADHRVAHVYAFREDKVARMDVYENKSEALEAAGLRE